MDPKEKKEMTELVGEVIDRKVTPRLEKIEKKLSDHDKKFETIIEQVVKNSENITDIKEDLSELNEEMTDVKYVDERIETKLDSSIRRETDLEVKTSQLSRRVLRLESKKTS
ncbi:MAG: hypothetical protein ABSE91_01670 [Patescibacteria group bacterium]